MSGEIVRAASVPTLPVGWRTWPAPRKKVLLRTLQRAKFRRTYEFDPVAFVHDCYDWERIPGERKGPTSYQEETLSNLITYGREAIRGPHGIGKTGLAAWVIDWFALTRDGDDWKNPTSASAWRQLKEYLWPEVHKWSRVLRWDVIGREPFLVPRELQDMALRLDTGSAFAVASDDPAAIEGAHAERLLYIYDEAKTIPKETFEASEGAFSGAGADTGREAFALAMSTPGPPHGRFYEIHQRKVPGWHARHVKLHEAVNAGRISRTWVEERKADWGERSALYANRVLGEFAAGDNKSVIPLEWVELAVERWLDIAIDTVEEGPHVFGHKMLPTEGLGPMSCVSADVSDQGEDKTVVVARYGPAVRSIDPLPFEPDPMESTGAIVRQLKHHTEAFPVVDSIGVGSGVVARLRELRAESEITQKVVAFDAGEASHETDSSGELEFENKRAAAWWGLRDRLHPTKGDGIMLPPDDELIADLTTPTWKQTSRSRILIEAKDDLRKADRLGRSPDKGDAVVMAFYARPPSGRSKSAAGRRIPGT